MKVYVVERGLYDECYVQGVYATPEAAMAANPVEREAKVGAGGSYIERAGGWQPNDHSGWDNGLDWGSHASITPYDLES